MAKPDKQVDTLKVPPHSIEAEQSVLGGLMLDNQAFDRVAELVVAQDFYTRTHKLIFEAMVNLAEGGDPIDLITISESEEASNLEEVKAASAKWNKKRKKFQGKDSVVIEQNESLEV